MKTTEPIDLVGCCKLCGGVIVWADSHLYGVKHIAKDSQERGLDTDYRPRSQIRLLPQGHAHDCPNSTNGDTHEF